jgi:calcineurin-like phosphoesterase family protein
MSRTFITSDRHRFHTLVAQLRGFSCAQEHDEALDATWRATVGPEDNVWVLGDETCTSNRAKVEEMLILVADLPGTKHLIVGNHDVCHPMHRDAFKWQRAYLGTYSSVQTYARRTLTLPGSDLGSGSTPTVPGVKTTVLLSHFPYSTDHTDISRYPQYRLPDLGSWLWHGHTHSAVRRTSARELHVGLDAWDLAPVALETLIAEMALPFTATTTTAAKWGAATSIEVPS